MQYLSINAIILGAKNGHVFGTGILVHKGKSTHVWRTDEDKNERLTLYAD